MDEQSLEDQLEPIFRSSIPIQDVALKTCRELWEIETGSARGPGRSAQAVQRDDDDDDDIKTYMPVFGRTTTFSLIP